MDVVTKWSMTLVAKEALRLDDAEAFGKALAQGADIRASIWGDTLWTLAVDHGAIECFKRMLPLVNLKSGPESEVAGMLLSGALVVPGNMGMGPSPSTQKFIDACRGEIERREAQENQWSVLADQVALKSAAPDPKGEAKSPTQRL